MFLTVWRTVLVRIRPDELIVFKPLDEDVDVNHSRSLVSKMRQDWKESRSMFSWADKGQWHTARTSNEDTRREGDWFRIGFEPLFVDFTKSGSWFAVISLVEVSGGCRACSQGMVVCQLTLTGKLDLLPSRFAMLVPLFRPTSQRWSTLRQFVFCIA